MSKNPPGTQVAKVGDKNTVRDLVTQMKGSLAEVLPKHLTPDRVLKMALVAVSRQPKLLECTKESFARSVMQSAELGLDCSGTLGSAYLVPYWSSKLRAFEAQFIPGYRGLIDLARRSGQVSRIEAHLVYKNDDYELVLGTEPVLVHKPKLDGPRGEVVFAYMVAELVGGSKQVESMTLDELNAIKKRSKSRDRDGNLVGPWVTDEGEMRRKTVVRRGVKYLPLSPERASDLAKALDYDKDLLDMDAITEVTAEDRTKQLDARLDGKEHAAPAADAESPEKCPHCDGPIMGGETDKCPHCKKPLQESEKKVGEIDAETKAGQKKLWSLLEKLTGDDPIQCEAVLHEVAGTVQLEKLHGTDLDLAIKAVEERLKEKGGGPTQGELL